MIPKENDLASILEERLITMGEAAKCLSEADYGSDRQIGAANAYFSVLESLFPEAFGEGSDFAAWALKATQEEMLDESRPLLRRLGALPPAAEPDAPGGPV